MTNVIRHLRLMWCWAGWMLYFFFPFNLNSWFCIPSSCYELFFYFGFCPVFSSLHFILPLLYTNIPSFSWPHSNVPPAFQLDPSFSLWHRDQQHCIHLFLWHHTLPLAFWPNQCFRTGRSRICWNNVEENVGLLFYPTTKSRLKQIL